jgi:hypothetical protein
LSDNESARFAVRFFIFGVMHTMFRILSALFVLAVLSPAHAAIGPAPGADPERHWQSADTAHFRINYAMPRRAQAERVADIAEHVYSRMSRQLQWEPGSRIEIILLDEFDIPNGYSTPLPFNESAIFLTPPNDGELLDNSVWLEMLLTHELTHTFHLDKVRGAPNVLRHIFGRNPLLFPNLWQPDWAIEGIATYNESTPKLGKGRLRGPIFEAWMRIEHEQGFKSLAEINSDGRALPTSKQYLYGVYFYDFLARKYGPDAIYNYINNFSNNIVPRVYTNPVEVTGKHMDELWDEFIADLAEQMKRREVPIEAAPRADGDVILPANFEIASLAPAADGVLATVDDGLLQPSLVHIDTQGKVSELAKLNPGAYIDTRADGTALIAQPEICHNFNYYYDLYTWSASGGLQRQTTCGRYRRAVWLGDRIAALRMDGGVATLCILERHGDDWNEARTLYRTPDQVEAIDLATSPDGKRIALGIKQAGSWQVLEFDSAGGTPRVLFNYNAPLHGLRYARDGGALEFIAVKDGIYDLWRYTSDTLLAEPADCGRRCDAVAPAPVGSAAPRRDRTSDTLLAQPADCGRRCNAVAPAPDGSAAPRPDRTSDTLLAEPADCGRRCDTVDPAPDGSAAPRRDHTPGLTRLSHTYTAVLSHSGIAQDGSVVLGVLAANGTELRRMQTAAPIAQQAIPVSNQTALLQGNTPPTTYQLGEPGNYHAVNSMYPRTWLPSVLLDRGLSAYGASTFGSDALGWHNYTADVMWETSQHEAIGSLSYNYLGEHFFNVSRNLWARQSTGSGSNQTTTLFDRTTGAQWASMLPWMGIQRSVYLGVGAAMQTTDHVQVPGLITRTQDERVGATFLRYDTRNTNWYADGVNRGNLTTLLYESYRPFTSFYDGYISRFDTREYLPVGKTVLSGRWTEVRAQGSTEQFQLGGATEYDLTQAPMLNQRNLPLRGYIGSEAALRGQNTSMASIEWRTPLSDIDRHAMSPPLGINRLSASAFMDAGSVWDNGNPRSRYYRGVGIELLGEVIVYYRLQLPLRLGIARGLDNPSGTQAYLQLGQSF